MHYNILYSSKVKYVNVDDGEGSRSRWMMIKDDDDSQWEMDQYKNKCRPVNETNNDLTFTVNRGHHTRHLKNVFESFLDNSQDLNGKTLTL